MAQGIFPLDLFSLNWVANQETWVQLIIDNNSRRGWNCLRWVAHLYS